MWLHLLFSRNIFLFPSLKKIRVSSFAIYICLLCCSPTMLAQVKINEIFLTNCSYDILKPDYNYLNWLELYNAGTGKAVLTGFYLTDDAANLQKWKFSAVSLPAKGFATFYLNGDNAGYRTSLKPDADGGVLILSDMQGNIVDKITYQKQYFNCSYGRYPDGSDNIVYFDAPTRAAANAAITYSGKTGDVVFTRKGGFYNAAISLELQSVTPGASIYYSTDGSEPGKTSKQYTGTIAIGANTVVRARAVAAGKLPGTIQTQTFFINQRIPNLPVVSIVTTPANLWDTKIGIYIQGSNGISGNCYGSANWNQDWERCANFELFNAKQNQVLNQIAGIKIAGGCSRSFNPQKSLAITTKSKYGKSKLNYKFFDDRDCDNFNSIMLRNSGNDFNNTMFRDNMIQKLTDANMKVDHQASTPAVLFLNGLYYGIQNIDERSGEDLVESLYALPEDSINVLERDGSILKGQRNDYDAFIQYVTNADMTSDQTLKYIESQIDMDEYIDYLILEIYCGNDDWPGNNIKFWQKKDPGSRWRWILFDTDFGYGLNGGPEKTNLNSILTIDNDWPYPTWSTFLFRKLNQNAEFKRKFVNRFYTHINTTFNPDRVIATIDSMAALIKTEIPFHFAKWGADAANWPGNVESMRSYARLRPDYMRQQLADIYGLEPLVAVTYHSVKPGYGTMLVDHISSVDTTFNGMFPKNTIANIQFQPAVGYTFSKAQAITNANAAISYIKSGDTWHYFDAGNVNNPDWFMPGFDDTAWKTGKSQLGYGENDEQTLLSFGPDANNKYVTSYFRTTFAHDSTKKIANLVLNLLYDDGTVIYLNGKQLLKVNMPEGDIAYETFASPAVSENVFFSFPIDSSLLNNGTNTLAVEMHQSTLTSSDISFDLTLSAVRLGVIKQYNITSSSFVDTLSANTTYYAEYVPESNKMKLIINEISPVNWNVADDFGEYDDWFEVYNTGNDTVNLNQVFFTDSLSNPLKIRIKANSSKLLVPPGGYKLIWADKDMRQGPLHIDFKLSAVGEELGMYQKMGEEIVELDKITYGKVNGLKCYGRFPNITGDFKWLNKMTPEAENLDVPEIIAQQHVLSGIEIKYFSSSHTLAFTSGSHLTGKHALVNIADVDGRALLSRDVTLSANSSINIAHLKPGVYIVSVLCNSAQTNCKIVVLR